MNKYISFFYQKTLFMRVLFIVGKKKILWLFNNFEIL
jgi:hypothetical protein